MVMTNDENAGDLPGRSPEPAETHQVPVALPPSQVIPEGRTSVDQVRPEVQSISPDKVDGPALETGSEQTEDTAALSVAAESHSVTPSEVSNIEPEVPGSPGTVLTKTERTHDAADAAVLADSRRHTRRAFAAAALAAAAGYGFYHWLPRSAQDMAQPALLRRTLQANAVLSRTLFDERALAPTYPLSTAETLRVNGVYGLKRALVPESWRLQLVGAQHTDQHPRFSKDVTSWEYRYTDVEAQEDQGHDTKVAPL